MEHLSSELSSARENPPHISTQRYQPEDIATSTLRALSPELRAKFLDWIEGMTPEVDNERGSGEDGFKQFLLDHEQVLGDRTYVFLQKGTENILATASVIAKDRTVEAEPGGWMLGGVNVHRDVRRLGIGTAVCELIDKRFADEATEAGAPVTVKLFTNYEPAIKIYERLGYVVFEAPTVAGYAGGGEEAQYRKIFAPGDSINNLTMPNVPA